VRVERLSPSHELGAFNCGVELLDDWLKSHALENQGRDLSRTFVLTDDDNDVVGYYSLAMGGVSHDELPGRLGRNLPNYQISMVLLARLAIDVRLHSQGYGRDLLIDALGHAVTAGTHAAARVIGVDPIDENARAFYKHFGFREIDGDLGSRMFMRLDDAAASFGAEN
jgi:GNAT superfamily N-acetyltransferase